MDEETIVSYEKEYYKQFLASYIAKVIELEFNNGRRRSFNSFLHSFNLYFAASCMYESLKAPNKKVYREALKK